MEETLREISNSIDVIENCPKEGVFFRDISSLFLNPTLLATTAKLVIKLINKKNISFDKIGFIDSRGYLFAGLLFEHFKKPIVMFRKPKLPYEHVYTREYGTEYSKDKLCLSKNSIAVGESVLIVDDLLATGGSFGACIELVEKDANGIVVGCFALIDLFDIPKNNLLNGKNVFCLFSNSSKNKSKTILQNDVLQIMDAKRFIAMNNCDINDTRIVIFAHPSMESVANDIVNNSALFRLGSIIWGKFPDGYFNIQFEENLLNKKIVYVASLFKPEDFLEIKTMMAVFARQGCESCDYYIPYFAPATMERVPQEGMVATAETTAHAIGAGMPLTKNGPVRIHIFDIHATVERFYFTESVQVRMDTMVYAIKTRFPSNATIVFPDDGAKKRFYPYFSTNRIIVCQKTRIGDERHIIINETYGFPEKKYVENYNKCFENLIIFDDLAQTGGTILETAKALKNTYGEHIKCIGASVIHAVFPNDSHMKFVKSNLIDTFYVTNTNPIVTEKLQKFKKFVVVPISDVMIEDLCKIHDVVNRKRTRNQLNIPMNSSGYPFILNVLVASNSNVKLTAVYEEMKCIYHANIYSIDTKSNVPNQPFNEQTQEGCENRFNQLVKYNELNNNKFDILISIENGVNTEQCYDFCVIKMRIGNRDILKTSSIITPFPKNYLNSSIALNQTITVGEIMESMNGITHKKDNWHDNFKSTSDNMFGNCSRIYIIKSTLDEMFY